MNELKKEKIFPRQVVISPGYGAGLVSWWSEGEKGEDPYDLAESPELIECVEKGLNEFQTKAFLIENGWDEEWITDQYFGGWNQATITEVYGPYKIDEYDGSESIQSQSGDGWRG